MLIEFSKADDKQSPRESLSFDYQSFLERNFLWALGVITLASLIPRLILGLTQYISYDGYWHIFIATQGRWNLFWLEIRDNAHPPLFYFLLRFVSRLGHSRLVYRSISISAGVGSTYVFGLIAGKVCRNRAVALLAAAAYGFAITNIDLTTDVRSYAIAILFSLLAFNAYLDYLAAPLDHRAPRAIAEFAGYTALAILSEYYAIFFLAACMAVPWVRALADTEFRRAFVLSVVRSRRAWVLNLCGLTLIIFTLYRVHLRYQPAIEGNVTPYYWNSRSGASVWRFLIDNLRREISFFFPLHVGSDKVLILIVFVFLPILVYLLFFRRKPTKSAVAAIPSAVLLALFCELMTLSVLGRYPFGGEMRQQSIVAPFFVLTGFIIFDLWIGRIQRRIVVTTMLALVSLLIVTSFTYQWKHFPRGSREIDANQYDAFRSRFGSPRIVYTDQLSLILFFTYNHASKWVFEKQVDDAPLNAMRAQEYGGTGFGLPAELYIYCTKDESGQPQEVVRDRRVWNFDLSNPGTYKWLVNSFHMAGVRRAILFTVVQFGTPLGPAAANTAQDRFKKYASQAGLKYGRSFFDGTAGFIELSLSDEQSRQSSY